MAVMEPKHNLILILLCKLTGKETATEIYDKTRFAWRTKLKRAQTVDYVIAHDSDENRLPTGYVLTAFYIHANQAHDTQRVSSIYSNDYVPTCGTVIETSTK